jgi:hypothetical protein
VTTGDSASIKEGVKALAAMILGGAMSWGAAQAGLPSAASTATLEMDLLPASEGLRSEVLHAALQSWNELSARGEVQRPLLAVIDFSLPSTDKRMWVFDLEQKRLVFHELVAHGRNSGLNMAESFSNDDGSYMSSLGAFVTGAPYDGKNGYSLRLRGTQPAVNDHAESRAIVMHGAPYVSDELIRSQGRIGRSLGCPAVRPEVARPLIDEIKGGSVLYVWHPSMAR